MFSFFRKKRSACENPAATPEEDIAVDADGALPQDRRPRWLEAFSQYATANPDNEPVRALHRYFIPYFGSYLPDPTDAARGNAGVDVDLWVPDRPGDVAGRVGLRLGRIRPAARPRLPRQRTVDWTVNAALLALTQIALDTPEATEEIRELFRDRIRAAPKQGAVCYVPVLACCSLQLPESRHGGHRY